MNDSQRINYLSAIHQLLLQHFDEQDLIHLCFGLGIEYADLPASGRSNKARELLTYLERRGRLSELRTAISRQRPHVTWPAADTTATSSPRPSSRRQLEQDDFDRLARLLIELPDFRLPERRFVQPQSEPRPRRLPEQQHP